MGALSDRNHWQAEGLVIYDEEETSIGTREWKFDRLREPWGKDLARGEWDWYAGFRHFVALCKKGELT